MPSVVAPHRLHPRPSDAISFHTRDEGNSGSDAGGTDRVLEGAPPSDADRTTGGIEVTAAYADPALAFEGGNDLGPIGPIGPNDHASLRDSRALGVVSIVANTAPSAITIASTARGGLDFNTAGNDAYLVADDGSSLMGARTALTLEAQFTLGASSGSSTLLSYAVDGQSDNDVSLVVSPAGRVDLYIGGAIRSTPSSHAQLRDGTQHQISVSWDSAGGNVVFYIDGNQVASSTGFMSGYTVAPMGTLLLGQDQDIELGSFDATQAFSGTLLDVRVFDGIRTAGEVAAAALTTVPYNATGLLANWTFNDLSSAGVITDTVNANNLTVGHATGAGFTANQPALTLAVAENSSNGTLVGNVVGSDQERTDRIAALLAADSSLRYSAETSQFYRLVNGIFSWTVAEAAARSGAGTSVLNGVTGQLASIRSASDNEIVWNLAQDYASDVWVGASDLAVEGAWRWMQGGAAADQFWSGGMAGSAVGGAYANWEAGEPNNSAAEDHGMLYVATGTWNDITDISAFTPGAYVVQWDADTVLDATHPLTYSLVSQSVPGAFAIDSNSGRVTVANGSLIDREALSAHGITVRTSDGSLSFDQTFSIALSNVHEAPVITSNGGGATATVSVDENGTAVTSVAAGVDITGTATYSIAGGADAARFGINPSSGALSFVTAANFEAPADANADNVYQVTVQVADGVGGFDTQALSVTVNNANEAPVISSQGGGATAAITQAENTVTVTTVTATDPDAPPATLVYSIAGGADAARFSINGSTGLLRFTAVPDHESPVDANGDNVYLVTVRVSDGTLTDTQALTITVAAVNDSVPVIFSNGGAASAALSVTENTIGVTTVAATDADGPASTLVYSIVGGPDAARFSIDGSTGALRFVTAPDYENPADSNADNVYQITVLASDGSLADSQALTVTVTAANDNAPLITSHGGAAAAALSVVENTTGVTTVTATDADRPAAALVYSIVGGADAARFSINGSSGALSFTAVPDYESPADANGDNVYLVTVRASDGTLTATQALTITVTAANDNAPVISSHGGAAAAALGVAENTRGVITLVATDADLPAGLLVYGIAGGSDAARFAIDGSTGLLSFVTAPDHESPVDADADNTYQVTVQVSDGTNVATQSLSIAVSDVNEAAPVVTAGQRFVLPETSGNGVEVGQLRATDADGTGTLGQWTIRAGNAGGAFAIDPGTGRVTVADASRLDFETLPTYTLRVSVSDGGFVSSEQAVTIDLSDVPEPRDGIVGGPTANVRSLVVTLPAAGSGPAGTASTTVTLVADSDNGQTSNDPGQAQITRMTQAHAPADLPAGMNMPLGLVSFAAAISTPGTRETFSVYVDATLGVNGYWTPNAAGIWVNLASPPYGGNTVMEGGRLRLDFQITDGSEFDADGRANGVIDDAGAPGFLPQSVAEYPPIVPLVGIFGF